MIPAKEHDMKTNMGKLQYNNSLQGLVRAIGAHGVSPSAGNAHGIYNQLVANFLR